MYIVCPSVLNCSNLKLHQTSEVKSIFKQEKPMLQLAFNPGLMLTGFPTTRPRDDYFKKTLCFQSKTTKKSSAGSGKYKHFTWLK